MSDKSSHVHRGLRAREASGGGSEPHPDHGDASELATPGLHAFLTSTVLPRYAPLTGRACDLGAGTGALTNHLLGRGWHVVPVDRDADRWRSPVPLVAADLNGTTWQHTVGDGFDLVLAVEVIEHLESPIAFLRTIRALLAPSGIAILTTPNMDSLAARAKFLFTGRLRAMDSWGDPTHISPVFRELLARHYLPRAELDLVASLTYPQTGYVSGRPLFRRALNATHRLLGDRLPSGDNLVLILRPAPHLQPSASPGGLPVGSAGAADAQPSDSHHAAGQSR